MTKLIKDILLFSICARLLYIEPELELTIIESFATFLLFMDFSFREHITNYFNKLNKSS